MRHLATVFLLGGCLVPESSTFSKLDDNYIPAPSSADVEIYIDSPPPRRFRVVGTIRVGFVAEGTEPIIAARRARKHGCDLVTTQLDGAVAAATPAPPLFHHASWSGSSGGSSRSGGNSSGGGGGGGDSNGTASAPTRLFYCGIYIEPAPAPAPVPTPDADVIRSSLT